MSKEKTTDTENKFIDCEEENDFLTVKAFKFNPEEIEEDFIIKIATFDSYLKRGNVTYLDIPTAEKLAIALLLEINKAKEVSNV
jgi:hypothetical protein